MPRATAAAAAAALAGEDEGGKRPAFTVNKTAAIPLRTRRERESRRKCAAGILKASECLQGATAGEPSVQARDLQL